METPAPTRAPSAHAVLTCDEALAAAFGVLGKRWTGMLLGILGGGDAGYNELRRAIGGISDSVLSARLAELTGAGLVTRLVVDGHPPTVRYTLTRTGEALLPALAALGDWARDHLLAT
jgi:DNA-binding HxlR family transcriptional regulator